MEAAVGFGVGCQALAGLATLTAGLEVGVRVGGKVVAINKVVARVVGRVDVDKLDLAEVGLLQ
jgi:hypothetical protein